LRRGIRPSSATWRLRCSDAGRSRRRKDRGSESTGALTVVGPDTATRPHDGILPENNGWLLEAALGVTSMLEAVHLRGRIGAPGAPFSPREQNTRTAAVNSCHRADSNARPLWVESCHVTVLERMSASASQSPKLKVTDGPRSTKRGPRGSSQSTYERQVAAPLSAVSCAGVAASPPSRARNFPVPLPTLSAPPSMTVRPRESTCVGQPRNWRPA